MFNLLLCKLFEEWLYGNCSLVLYIYRCTLCRGQGNCAGFILSFQGSISEAICETGQIKLGLTLGLLRGRPTGATPQTFILPPTRCSSKWNSSGRRRVDKLSKSILSEATSSDLRDSSSINYWLCALIPSLSSAYSLPRPLFTLVVSADVIIPTNCRLEVLGQWGHLIGPTTLFSGG